MANGGIIGPNNPVGNVPVAAGLMLLMHLELLQDL